MVDKSGIETVLDVDVWGITSGLNGGGIVWDKENRKFLICDPIISKIIIEMEPMCNRDTDQPIPREDFRLWRMALRGELTPKMIEMVDGKMEVFSPVAKKISTRSDLNKAIFPGGDSPVEQAWGKIGAVKKRPQGINDVKRTELSGLRDAVLLARRHTNQVLAESERPSGMLPSEWTAMKNRFRAYVEQILGPLERGLSQQEAKFANTDLKKIFGRIPEGKQGLTVTFMCEGNINRSPGAEMVTRDLLAKQGIPQDRILVNSCGLSAVVGEVNENLVKIAHEHGIEGEGVVAQQATVNLVDNADIIITATAELKDQLLRAVTSHAGEQYAESLRSKIIVFGDIFTQEMTPEEQGSARDKAFAGLVNDQQRRIVRSNLDDLATHLPDPQGGEIGLEGMLLLIKGVVKDGLMPRLVEWAQKTAPQKVLSNLDELSTPSSVYSQI